jgi:hypothetical protein
VNKWKEMKNSNELIFIAGFPRSGTTWFSNLLNSHEKVIYRHEIIGRNYDSFGEKLMNALKTNHGLSNIEYKQAMSVIAQADVNVDKPPFFKKEQGFFGLPRVHYLCWLATKALPFLRKSYNYIFNIANKNDLKILLKETRSTKNLDSILKGLRAENIIFLVRLPYGTIASHLKGESMGAMEKTTEKSKSEWFEYNKRHPYMQSINLTLDQLSSMSIAEYYAIQWRIYHEDLIHYKRDFPDAIFCFYDDFVCEPVEETKSLFQLISLQYNAQVENFIESSTGKISSPSILKDSNNDYYSVYRQASYDKEAWKKVLTHDDIEKINLHTQDYYQDLKNTFRVGRK